MKFFYVEESRTSQHLAENRNGNFDIPQECHESCPMNSRILFRTGTTDCNVAVAFWQLAFCRATCTIDLEQSRKPREVTHAAKNPKSSISSNVHVAIVIVDLVTSPQFFNFIRSKRLNWVYRDGFSNTKIIIVLQLNFYLNCFSLDII